jgi:hypothetical protein
MDHRLALDFVLAKQGGVVCAITNTSCCTYINTSGIVEERADYILQQAKWLREQSLETCILNLLVKFVSFCLESIKLQMPLVEMKMTYYRGPLDNPSRGQP